MVGVIEKLEDRKWEMDKKVGGWKKFSFLSFVFGWEDGKAERWKLISLVEKKNEMMDNEVGINLQLCSY